MEHHAHSNVVDLRGGAIGPANIRRRDLPLGPALPKTTERLREIAAISGDHLATEGPAHPDHRLLDLCAIALDLIRQADAAAAMSRRDHPRGWTWTDVDRASRDAARDRAQICTMTATHYLRQIRKLRATTVAGVYAKALLVRGSVTGAAALAQSLADDLIACPGMQGSLNWPAREA